MRLGGDDRVQEFLIQHGALERIDTDGLAAVAERIASQKEEHEGSTIGNGARGPHGKARRMFEMRL
jgi:hypothetical protein